MPVFMNPLAFWSLFTMFLLVGIYYFRRQSKDIKVSSLMFFNRVKIPAEGGRRRTELQTPIILLVELLILLFLVLAAANPKAIIGERKIPLAVILDDSFSMQAGAPKTPRNMAEEYLRSKVFAVDIFTISLIKAGSRPEIIGRTDMSAAEALFYLSSWTCNSPDADLQSAVRHVKELFAPDTRMIVISDRKSEEQLTSEISWLSFGSPMPNLAITAANRYALGETDRCFFEFANLSSASARLTAEIVEEQSGVLLEKIDADLAAGGRRRVRLTLKKPETIIRARIFNDPVAFDNEAWLIPVRRQKVKTALDIDSNGLKELIEKTLKATGLSQPVESGADLVLCDKTNFSRLPAAWRMIFHGASQPALLAGSISVDKSHPVCAGFPPVRANWAVDLQIASSGYPLISAAELPLLDYTGNPDSEMILRFNFNWKYSNLQLTPVWPVLFWNILSWRQQFMPGPDTFNSRSGMEINVVAPGDTEKIEVAYPGGRKSQFQTWNGKSVFSAEEPGLYKISAGPASWSVAVNLSSARESDLMNRIQYSPEFEVSTEKTAVFFSDVRWWFVIPAVLLMLVHQWILNTRRRGNVY